ncbi:hypothetical protein [Singulisphaera sp. GP187]|uniref:hypothetical protein n=1 Tax=Singulisphaera sp. GP187 TaxID=1882752 RepID=UPI0011615123|nr:hypothetical protein [Singulisphaera sp. GP187]
MNLIATQAMRDIAPLMRGLARSRQATFSYEMMSGALVWSDELPEFRVLKLINHWQVIRFVLRFRTTLILEEPDEQFRKFWDEAHRRFPEWPGFAPKRRSSQLREAFLIMESRAFAEFQEMDQEADEETTSG